LTRGPRTVRVALPLPIRQTFTYSVRKAPSGRSPAPACGCRSASARSPAS
jgi:hypothetical protein